MRVLKHNWPVKLLALAVAVVLSFYVRGQQNRVLRTMYLPVIIPAPVGQRVVEPSAGTTIKVDLEGPAELLGSLTSEEITLTIDPGGVQPGKSVKVPVAVEIPERLRNLGVEAVWRPQTIPVKLISDARRQLPVEVEPLDKPEGWELKAPPQTTPAQVAISGAQQDVALVHRLRATLPLKPSEWVSELSSVRAEDAEGNDITDLVKPTPAQVKVTATLERVVLQKDVPIQPVFRVPPGVRVTAEVIPPLVRLIGPERRLSSVYVVETTPFEVPAGKAQFTKTITLVLPGAGITMRPDSVKVIIRTQAAATARPVR
ncbi:MAG: hypothetical protein K0Q72_4196 [Armatimonadetes bacterium]|jgi:YbbR domain-containing protein|nr:hypothetical protein [Armatimonadota bacterium]